MSKVLDLITLNGDPIDYILADAIKLHLTIDVDIKVMSYDGVEEQGRLREIPEDPSVAQKLGYLSVQPSCIILASSFMYDAEYYTELCETILEHYGKDIPLILIARGEQKEQFVPLHLRSRFKKMIRIDLEKESWILEHGPRGVSNIFTLLLSTLQEILGIN